MPLSRAALKPKLNEFAIGTICKSIGGCRVLHAPYQNYVSVAAASLTAKAFYI
jgi:hypothetical protein